ncbi:MAG: 1,4-dihydroxy-2-naphthoate octaprenyltransferase [Crocinitomicaceae bacterium]|nr:1,4-dihydroxy-2-naphthoate octaprenyltransferase [Crocinitomicaceae bacterium]
MIKSWLHAARLRTLPLSISGIIVGTGLATLLGAFDGLIFSLALLTTIGFQVLSNFANDLGDSQKGTDNAQRVGPARAIQSGQLSAAQMKIGMWVVGSLSLLSALLLIKVSIPNLSTSAIYTYVMLAGLCIAAAITYTVGKNAYGYRGLGDIMVFIFFGLVSVIGVFGLYGENFEWLVLFPAISIGTWSTAVLNLNNLRDVQNDAQMQKRTMVVKLGFDKGKIYHVFLVATGLATWFFTIYLLAVSAYNYYLFLALLPSFGLVLHLKKVLETRVPAALDPELKKVALLTFFSALLFAILLNFAPH